MSRFFAESDSESGSGSEVEEIGLGQLDGFQDSHPNTSLAARFQFDDSDYDEERRVVRSQKEKRFEELENAIKTLRNYLKIRDWVKIAAEYDTIQGHASHPKMQTVIKTAGVPRFYLKAIVQLTDVVEEAFADKAARKKLSGINAKSLSKLRQHLTKKNKLFVKELKDYKLNPDASEESGASSSDGEESDAGDIAIQSAGSDEESEAGESDDSIDWDSESDYPSSSDDERAIENREEMRSRDFWVKKKNDIGSKRIRKRKERVTKDKKTRVVSDEEGEKKREKVEWTPELIQKKLQELFKARGRANFNKRQAIKDLEEMHGHAKSVISRITVLCTLIGALFDVNLNKATYMPIELWKKSMSVITELVDLLLQNPEVRLRELNEDVEEDLYEEAPEEDAFAEVDRAQDDKAEPVAPAQKAKKAEEEVDEMAGFETIRGNLCSFILTMNMEFRKSLQLIDYNEPLYEERRGDSPAILALIRSVRSYYGSIDHTKNEARMCALLLEHCYPEYDASLDVQSPEYVHKSLKTVGRHGKRPAPPAGEIENLYAFIFKHGDDRLKTQALLYRVTHLAIHNRFSEARDLMLMSRLPDTVGRADVATQIVFNRAQAQLALCAFRRGDYSTSQRMLGELYSTQHIKELLAQGVTMNRWQERTPEQELLERKRMLPNHLHISLDLLESAHFLSAMLLEMLNIALYPADTKRYHVSRAFRRLYDNFLETPFHGPPETTRDFIMHASKALSNGDWRKCVDHVMEIKMWSLIPNEEEVRATLTQRIKEVSLHIYLVAFGAYYISLPASQLAKLFSMEESVVRRSINKMIALGDLSASWDGPSDTLHLHSQPCNFVQKKAMAFCGKLNVLIDQNAKSMEIWGRQFGNRRGGGGGRDQRRGDLGGQRDYRGGARAQRTF
eukprot:70822_1